MLYCCRPLLYPLCTYYGIVTVLVCHLNSGYNYLFRIKHANHFLYQGSLCFGRYPKKSMFNVGIM